MTNYGQEGPFRRGDILLEQFEITRLLGTGGHAYVYECRDQFLDELLAVKVIPNPPNRGRELLDRARAEAQLLRRLSHPNVVRMHTAATLRDDMVCLVMEKLDGVTLRHLLALLTRLSVVEALSIVRQVAIGVGAAHQLDVVHRDIKPDNVFVLPPKNHVKVLDFGIAKFLGHGLQTSNKYRFQGTPLYMSPEHLKGAGVTVRSDVYQLGTVLFELIAGVNPSLIDLDNPEFEQVAFVQITRQTPSLIPYGRDVPEYVDRLVQRATAKDPQLRFGSMNEFVEAIDWTMAEYLRADPGATARIRYVDASLMSAAKNLAALEAAYGSNPPTDLVDGPPPCGNTEAPETVKDPPRTLNEREHTGKAASYHPIPNLAGPSQTPSTRASSTRSVPGLGQASQQRSKRSLSASFVLFAIGFGTVGGSAALWFLMRHSDTPDEALPPASTVAAVNDAPLPTVPLTSVPQPAPAAASDAPSPVVVRFRAAKATLDGTTQARVEPASTTLPPPIAAQPPVSPPAASLPPPAAPPAVSASPPAPESEEVGSTPSPKDPRLISGKLRTETTE